MQGIIFRMLAKISLSPTDHSVIAGLVVTAYVMIRLLILQKKQKEEAKGGKDGAGKGSD